MTFQPSMVTRFNVEKVTRSGTALYLDRACDWSSDAEDAFEYSDEEGAQADAEIYDGEVSKFQRLARRTDLEFIYPSEVMRLAAAYAEAAE